MAFYVLIVWVEYGVKCEVMLDFIEKTKPFVAYTHTILEEDMMRKMKEIQSTIDSIIAAEET